MLLSDPAEIAGSDRQAARERGFRLLATTVTALFAAFVTLGGVFLWYDSTADSVAHAHRVRSGIADAMVTLTRAESAQRGYLLTSERAFLEQVETAREEAERTVTEIELLTLDNPEQQKRIERLRTQMMRRMAVIDDTLERGRAGDLAGARAIILKGEGIAAMTAIGQLVTELDAAEARLEARRTARAATIRAILVITLIVFVLLLGALFIKALRDVSLDREAEARGAQRLRELLRQRTLLLDEVNHRVKNSLQQIASVVRLQARASESAETRAALEKTLLRIMAVGRVHEQTYKSGDQAGGFDAGLYAKTLAGELVDSMGRDNVRLETDVTSAVLDMRQAAPIALILNELVTNALKYGCPTDRAACIRVGFRAEKDEYWLTVSDQGDGLPSGFSADSRVTLGMRAIQALARQLNGQLVVQDSEVGAAFAVVFPRTAV